MFAAARRAACGPLPTRSAVAVLTHFQEDASCVARCAAAVRGVMGSTTRIVVYSKGPESDTLIPALSTLIPDPISVHYVKNEGREADSSLRFILSNYHKLPEVVVFTQSCPSAYDEFSSALLRWNDDMSMLNLGGFELGTCDGTASYPMHRLHDLYVMTHNDSFCPTVPFYSYMQGQFVVTRERIMRNSYDFYVKLHALLHAHQDSFIHQDVWDIPGKIQREVIMPREMNNNANYFSYVLERAWVIIFDCMKENTEPC